MIIEDKIYGTVAVNEPVLIELLESAPLQRLRGVTMGGIVAILGISPRTTRFEHSLGAMLLVRRLGASIEEQVAALLHDVSHTAFSHVIDYTFDRVSSQAFHDEEKENYVRCTEIPAICKEYGVNLPAVLDESRHSLLEQPSPRLCADRVDYTLRDLEPLGVASDEEAFSMLARITAVGGRMAFTDADAARGFGEAYIACATRSWANPRHSAFYELCGRALRHAYEAGLVHREDIWSSDEDLWASLQAAARRCRPVAALMEKIVADAEFIRASQEEADISARVKVRWIDPEVAIGEAAVPLSRISGEYAERISQYLRRTPEIVHLRVVQ